MTGRSPDGAHVQTQFLSNVAAAIRVAAGLPPDAAVLTIAVDTELKYLAGGR